MRFLRTLLASWIAIALVLGSIVAPSAAVAGQECAQAVADDNCDCGAASAACLHACSICHVFAAAVSPLAVAVAEPHRFGTHTSSPLNSLAHTPETGPPKLSC